MGDVVIRLNVVETPSEWILFCESPLGGTSSHVPVPFTDAELTSALHDLERSILRSSSKVLTRRSASPERTALEFGRRLADVLLTGESRVIFEECRNRARQNRSSMRVLLETHGEHVSQIPWEFAVDPKVKDDYLALRLSVARSLRVAEAIPPLSVTAPLRVLGVQARPRDLPQLDYEREQEAIAAAFDSVGSDLVKVTWLKGDRWQDIAEALRGGGWHVLHFVGHGGFNDELKSGYLELSDDHGESLRVSATRIGAVLSRSPDLRLVVLNACDSAATGGSGASASTAAKLMSEGIPAVVAMQYEITDPAALTFAAGFYEAIARNAPVDQAMTSAREIVRVTLDSLEWATPVLFLASDETRVFDFGPGRPAVARTSAPTTAPTNAPTSAPAATSAPAEDPRPSKSFDVKATRAEWSANLIDKLGGLLKNEREPVTPVPGRPTAVTPVAEGASEPVEVPAPDAVPAMNRLDATEALGPCDAIALGPNDMVGLACRDGSVRAWGIRSGRLMSSCALPRGVLPVSLSWSPWPRHIASAHDDGTVVVWDLQTEVPLRVLRPDSSGVQALAFSRNGLWLAVAGGDRSIQVFNSEGVLKRRFEVPSTPTGATGWAATASKLGQIAFAPGDRHLVVAANNGSVTQFDVHGRATVTWPHAHAVSSLAVGEERLVTCSVDGRLRFWGMDGRLVRRVETAPADHLALAADGDLLVSVARDNRVTAWSSTGQRLASAGLAGRPVGVGVSATYVVTGTEAGVLERWMIDREPAREGLGHE